MKRVGAAPLYCDFDSGYVYIHPDGRLFQDVDLTYSKSLPNDPAELTSPRDQFMAIRAGSEQIPELLDLLPDRPDSADTCDHCRGAGVLWIPLICPQCWAWVAPGR